MPLGPGAFYSFNLSLASSSFPFVKEGMSCSLSIISHFMVRCIGKNSRSTSCTSCFQAFFLASAIAFFRNLFTLYLFLYSRFRFVLLFLFSLVLAILAYNHIFCFSAWHIFLFCIILLHAAVMILLSSSSSWFLLGLACIHLLDQVTKLNFSNFPPLFQMLYVGNS